MTRNKTVLITGAGSGIGRALAIKAAQLGFDLILVGRTKASLQHTHGLISGVAVKLVIADVTSPEGRGAIIKATGDKLDILINNAGCLTVGRFVDLKDHDASAMIATNLLAPMLLTRDLLPALTASGGRIVNVGSVFGDIAYPFFACYSASKFGLRGFSDAIRRELSGSGVGVTYIAPRATKTAAESEFAALIEPLNMTLDSAEAVADQAWTAILAGKRESFPRGKERFFVKMQRLFPALVDISVGAQARDPKALAALKSVSKT